MFVTFFDYYRRDFMLTEMQANFLYDCDRSGSDSVVLHSCEIIYIIEEIL